jgi:GAF domain-containing protein
MPLLFWIEIGAYTFATVSALALALMVLGSGPGHRLNRLFALFTTLEAVWAVSAVLLRLSLWLQMGNPAFWLELAALALNAMGIILPMFAVRYVARSSRQADRLAALGGVALTLLAIPTFGHQLLRNPSLQANGIATYEVTRYGFIAPLLPVPYFIWSFVLFWRDRRHARATYLALSVLILLGGFLLGGILRPFFPAPILSVTVTLSVGLLGYGVVSKQLLNPLRELTTELERKVEERTEELRDTARRLEERSAQLQTAARIAREAVGIRDVDRLLDETVHLISDRFGFYHAGIFLLDQEGEYARLRAASSQGGQRMLARGHRLRVGEEGIVGHVTGRGEPRVALDVGVDAVFFDNPDLPATRSEMALPLKVRGDVIGALDVQSQEPAAFSHEDVEVLRTLADQVGIAISNARLFQQAQEALEAERRAYGQFSRQAWRRLLSTQRQLGARYDPRGILPGNGEWRDGMKRAIQEGKPVFGSESTHDEGDGDSTAHAALAVPIEVRGQIVGVLDSYKQDHGGAWTSDEVALMESLAQQLGMALESARLYQDAQRMLGEMRALNAIATTVSQSLWLDEVLQQTLEQTLSLTGYEIGLISLVEPDADQLYLAVDHGLPEMLRRRLREQGMTGTLCDYVYRRGTLLSVPDFTEGAPVDVRGLLRLGLHSYLGIPLESRGKVVGTICIFSYSAFSSEPALIPLLEGVGRQVGVAIENAQLFEQARQRAHRERLVTEVTASMREILDLETVLKTAAQGIRQAMDLPAVTVRLAGHNRDRLP